MTPLPFQEILQINSNKWILTIVHYCHIQCVLDVVWFVVWSMVIVVWVLEYCMGIHGKTVGERICQNAHRLFGKDRWKGRKTGAGMVGHRSGRKWCALSSFIWGWVPAKHTDNNGDMPDEKKPRLPAGAMESCWMRQKRTKKFKKHFYIKNSLRIFGTNVSKKYEKPSSLASASALAVQWELNNRSILSKFAHLLFYR